MFSIKHLAILTLALGFPVADVINKRSEEGEPVIKLPPCTDKTPLLEDCE